jgi:zinc transport system substrate-binding protein
MLKTKKSSALILINTAALVLGLVGCTQPKSNDSPEITKIDNLVYVTNESTRFITFRLLDDGAQIEGPEPDKGSPADWLPSDQQLKRIQASKLIVDSGVNYSQWMIKVSLPQSRIVELSYPLFDHLITVEDLTTHKHGPEGEHSHSGLVSTVWLDPQLLAIQAESLAERLIQLYPDQKQTIQQRLQTLKDELTSLAHRLTQLNQGNEPVQVISYAPVYKYLCRKANLSDKHFHWDLNQPLDAAQLEQLDAYLKQTAVKLVLVSQEPNPQLKQQLQERSLAYVIVDLCERLDRDNDYSERFQANLDRLESSLATQ